jgi:hypothetical protein
MTVDGARTTADAAASRRKPSVNRSRIDKESSIMIDTTGIAREVIHEFWQTHPQSCPYVRHDQRGCYCTSPRMPASGVACRVTSTLNAVVVPHGGALPEVLLVAGGRCAVKEKEPGAVPIRADTRPSIFCHDKGSLFSACGPGQEWMSHEATDLLLHLAAACAGPAAVGQADQVRAAAEEVHRVASKWLHLSLQRDLSDIQMVALTPLCVIRRGHN